MQTDIMQFRGEYFFMSNFYPCDVTYAGRVWRASEYAYQAAKMTNSEDFDAVYNAESPAKAKRLGAILRCRLDWASVRLGIMSDIQEAKFSIPELESMLLATGDTPLVEGNMHGDEFWGVDIRTGRGKNMSGKILTRIRQEKLLFE